MDVPAGSGGGSGGKATGGDEEEADAEAGAGKKRRKKGGQPLCRPIICVCNDLYAPVMRPLRDVAAVHQFKQPLVCRPCNALQCPLKGPTPL